MADKKQDTFESFDFDTQPVRGFPELRWAGKRPFLSTQYFPAQKREQYGDPHEGWWNKLFWGDNLQVMSHLLRDFRGKVDLIYIDPPFDSKADYKKPISVKGKSAANDHSAFEEKQYSDIWSSDQYLQFIYERLVLCRELLADDGTIYVHIGPQIGSHVKLILDEVFGPSNFRNNIRWRRMSISGFKGKTKLPFNHETLFCYTKGVEYEFNPIFIPYSDEYKQRFRYSDENGRLFRADQNIGTATSTDSLKDMREKGLVHEGENGKLYRKQFLDELPGVPLDDIWTDVPWVTAGNQRSNYPTQKPEALLRRIIQLSSKPNDLVFDCFMGSGTAQVAALKMGRRFIGADINLGAIETTVGRLNKILDGETSEDDFFENDEVKTAGFEVYNVNNYDIFRNPVEAKELIKEAMELQPLPTSSVFDGQRDQHLVKIMPVNRIATRADLNEVINGMDFKAYERRQAEAPSKIVDRIMLVCMGHEPDIGPELVKAAKPFNIEVEVVDLIRDKANLHFKRQSDAKLVIKDGHLEIAGFYPLNLLQKLSMDTDAVEDWRQLVETIKVDWNYDGAVLSPELIDAPDKNELVNGRYPIPEDASTIRVKITDLLSESWEGEIEHG
jgi:DNA modification methylase